MKKKLIILLALCFAFSTVVHATENVELVVENEVAPEVEESIEPEFSLAIETVTEIAEETISEIEEIETEQEKMETEVESNIPDDITEEIQPTDTEGTTEIEVVEEITETDVEGTASETTDPAVEEGSSEPETEVETGEIPAEASLDIAEEETEYIEAVVSDIVIADEITSDSKRIVVQITGANLLNKYANVKVRPINTYKDYCYIRTIVFDDDNSNDVEILLSDNMSGLYRVDVDVEKTVRKTKVIVVGESSDNELTCTTDKNAVIMTGSISSEEEKDINIKVLNESGNIVFIRCATTAADGSYTVRATLPGDDENYIVWVTAEDESKGYVKSVNFFNEDTARWTYDFTCQSNIGTYEEVFVYAKNISSADKYVYELDYSEYMGDVEIIDLCVLTREKENDTGYCYNTEIEILNASNGKIRFIVNSETPEGKVWSGLLNILKLKRKTSNAVTFTLRVYE